MTSPPDVQNVPDVWGLLEQAREVLETANWKLDIEPLLERLTTAVVQHERFVLVPKEPTREMTAAGIKAFQHARYDETNSYADWNACYRAMLAAAPKPEGKP